MRLERLEINGFKSFSERSELAFDKGVTAIVGPNGCGKSNVADAITWVMGEQSAKSLRGERMEDLIFSGSDGRKPTASAEVRLRFSGVLKSLMAPAFEGGVANGRANGNGNGAGQMARHNGHNGHGGNGHEPAEGNERARPAAPDLPSAEELIQSVAREVEVTRRLYRSGESEYLIDGEACRLKDIHDLLMDTGLGAKAYAIIEQGKIGLILSSRPADRRQLIEEAAGVTKYKSRRRSAELKLEAAQQNLTRIGDIVFEVEKQRGALKRQAARAGRYRKLRDELRRWETVLFARKYRQLVQAIESARARLSEAREHEDAAAVRVAGGEADLAQTRIELAEQASRAMTAREAAHSLELAINRRQQLVAFEREQVHTLDAHATTVTADLQALEARREPARLMLASRRQAADLANRERDRAAEDLAAESEAYETAHQGIEGLEADVEAARSEVFSAINSATALRHALQHAASARERVAETLSKLDVEAADVRIECERVAADQSAAAGALRTVQDAAEATRAARVERESELASARIAHERHARVLRECEHHVASLDARLKSLEELEASRAGYGDATRTILAQSAEGAIRHVGAVADFIDVEAGHERAVEAYLGDLLQYVVVERPEHAVAGFELVREANAGRCGFLVTSIAPTSAPASPTGPAAADGLVALSSVIRVSGPFAPVIRQAIGAAWIASSYEQAANESLDVTEPVVTRDGDVFRGAHLVAGGGRDQARGILETKREIKELRERCAVERAALSRVVEETAALEGTIAQTSNTIAVLDAEHHRQEKAVVGHELHLQRAREEAIRLAQKSAQLVRERRQAEEEREGLECRQEEARASIERLEDDQRAADERLTGTQRRLFEAREAAEDLSRRTADARASYAAFVERASALGTDVQRLDEAAAELEARAEALGTELAQTRRRVGDLDAAIAASEAQLERDGLDLEGRRVAVVAIDEALADLRVRAEEREAAIKDGRRVLESARTSVAELDIARATAESSLSHLAALCLETVQQTLEEVAGHANGLELETGLSVDDTRAAGAEETDELADDNPPSHAGDAADAPAAAGERPAVTVEDAIARLRGKIDRLGPVNMMAIEEFAELETRHAFLTSQRKDLVDSIAQTTQAIKRIDETTRERFGEAFAAINRNFQETFSTLFGGGRASLALLDETDPLESGIEIIAQPPGKRLQSVQLLSGGEKALAAIALMFGMFRYKPSPFCLLDEIDAPLDDANIGRFVDMLRAMLQHTQFIVITHNRKTMEIANRLYGVTMEEPGVSKLISVQLN